MSTRTVTATGPPATSRIAQPATPPASCRRGADVGPLRHALDHGALARRAALRPRLGRPEHRQREHARLLAPRRRLRRGAADERAPERGQRRRGARRAPPPRSLLRSPAVPGEPGAAPRVGAGRSARHRRVEPRIARRHAERAAEPVLRRLQRARAGADVEHRARRRAGTGPAAGRRDPRHRRPLPAGAARRRWPRPRLRRPDQLARQPAGVAQRPHRQRRRRRHDDAARRAERGRPRAVVARRHRDDRSRRTAPCRSRSAAASRW